MNEMYELNENNGEGIRSFTLAEMLETAGVRSDGLLRYCTAVHDHCFDGKQMSQPSHIDAILLGVVLEGRALFNYNLQECVLSRGSLFLFTPHNILQLKSAEKFRAHILLIDPAILEHINIDANRILPTLLSVGPRPSIKVDDDFTGHFGRCVSLISGELNNDKAPFAREIVCELITAIFYKVSQILQLQLSAHPESKHSPNGRAENYFRRFIELLGENYKQERGVSFYARNLCITPKYLTTLVKRFSGRSVSEWIDTFVIVEAKTMLRYTNLSIQEIAYRLNFANQSFFGSYFKRITGMSPSQYKADEK